MGRQDAMVNSLEELSCGNEAIKDIKASNDEWKDYMLHLSQSILKESNQKNRIKKISDGFLKELNGRINDLCDINNVYYDEDVENGKKKKKKKKKKVTEYEKDAEIEKFMAELMKEFGLKDNDDIDADNEDGD